MYRTRLYRRHVRARAIQRRKSNAVFVGWCYTHDGSYSKGKIHCSCPLCSQKSTRQFGMPSNSKAIRSKQLRVNDMRAKEQAVYL